MKRLVCLSVIALIGSFTTLSAADDIPDRDLRESAERILADPAFQGFDRFPTGSSAPEPPSNPTSSSEAAPSSEGDAKSGESARPSNWWDRLRQSGKKSKTQSGSDGPSSQQTQPAAPSSDGKAPSSPAPPSETARPQRSTSEPPAQRGQDGITRPVRFAPKVRTPKPADSGPDWNLNLGWLSGVGSVLGGLLHGMAYFALVAVCALIIALVVRAVTESWRSRSARGTVSATHATPLAHDRSPGETEADVFLREALRLADAGQYRPALGQLVLGSMSTLERRQWIRYRRGLTLNDYLRSVRSRPEQLIGLRSVIDSYEPVEFGRRAATESTFATALEGYRSAFRALDGASP
jgi:hypothetical protein